MNTKKLVFEGCATALVTPFKDGKIDFEALARLIDFQIENGAHALVILGTTGESPCVDFDERDEVVAFAKDAIRGRVPMLVGTGTNNTKTSIKLTQSAEKLGADGALLVTPYYNKATQKGICEHYKEIAKSTALPLILYNVPSRTGLRLGCEALEGLCELDSIVGIKEASGDVRDLDEKIKRFGEYFHFYTGCDELIVQSYALGGKGVISATSNVIPSKIATLCELCAKNDAENAKNLALEIAPLVLEMFAEVNPIPVKCALALMRLCENEIRLPLTPSTREAQIKAELSRLALL